MYRHPSKVSRNPTNYHSTVENSKCENSSASNSGNNKDCPSVAPAKAVEDPKLDFSSLKIMQAMQPRVCHQPSVATAQRPKPHNLKPSVSYKLCTHRRKPQVCQALSWFPYRYCFLNFQQKINFIEDRPTNRQT